MKIKDSFHTYAIITIIFWSLANVLTRLSLHYFSAFSLGFFRYLIASCALIVFAIVTKMKVPKKADIKWFVIAGFVGFFLYMIAFNKGCETVSSSTSSVMLATVPVITSLLSRFIYKEKLNVIKWAAIAVEFSGVIVLTLMEGVFTFNPGLLWLFGAAMLLSVYNLLQRKITKKYSGLQASTFGIFSGTIMLAIFLPTTIKQVQTAPPIAFVYVAVLGVFTSAVAYAAWSQAFKKAKNAASVSNYMFVTPFLASLMGYLLAGEKPDSATLIGGGIILLGLFAFNFGERILKHKEIETVGE
ncbi:MAG: EamA family transporter [Firmicutes bacterium HGW-Firmicutes-16]|nr:MAG: EamA family transporter [Firmicutes bacterium HGW-Firmicutes-16]